MMAKHRFFWRGRATITVLICCVFSFLASRTARSQKSARVHRTDWTASNDWPVYHGSSANIKYSTLDQVTPANVRSLRVAWR